jgi:hypothetical protein
LDRGDREAMLPSAVVDETMVGIAMPRENSEPLRNTHAREERPAIGLRSPWNRGRHAPSCAFPGGWLAAGALVWTLSGPGCAAYQNVGVISEPVGAEVFVDKQPVGKAPVKVRMTRDAEHSVFVKAEGYTPELVVVSLRDSKDGIRYLSPADVRVKLRRRAGPGDPGADNPELDQVPDGSDARERQTDRDLKIEADERRRSRRNSDVIEDEKGGIQEETEEGDER